MIIVNKLDKFKDVMVVNRKIRFKNPEVIQKTWYGIKIYAANRWYRLYFWDNKLYNDILFKIDLNNVKGK